MKILKFIIIFIIFMILTNPAYASIPSYVGINFNGANFWQESQNFKNVLNGCEVKNSFPDKNWWLQFNDPILSDYIEQSLRENQDIKIAAAHIEESNALARATMGKEFPQITLYGLFTRLKRSSNFLTPQVGNNARGQLPTVLAGGTSNLYVTPIVAQYEIDYLLKNHSKTKLAKKDAAINQFNYQTVLISLTSELATAYFNLLKADKLLELNTELLGYLQKSLELKNSLFKEGEISYDDVLINQQGISQTLSNIIEIQKMQSLFAHQLCILMGKAPLEQSCLPRSDFDNISFNNNIQVGIPCNLISRRPDILAAAAKLQKADINISLAFKDFFPAMNVFGVFGFASSSLSKLYDWKSNLSAIAVNAAQSLFTGGTKTAVYKANKAACKGVYQEYQKAILIAFQEVEDSLTKLNSDFSQYNEAQIRVIDSQKLLTLATSRYKEGENSYLDIINARQKLINDKQTITQSKSNLLIDNISLYKALGGGF